MAGLVLLPCDLVGLELDVTEESQDWNCRAAEFADRDSTSAVAKAHRWLLVRAALESLVASAEHYHLAAADRRTAHVVYGQRNCDPLQASVRKGAGLLDQALCWEAFSAEAEVLGDKAFVEHHPLIVEAAVLEQMVVELEALVVRIACWFDPVDMDRHTVPAEHFLLVSQKRSH